MREVVIVEAVRSPIGRRGGGLSGLAGAVGQIIGGCVGTGTIIERL